MKRSALSLMAAMMLASAAQAQGPAASDDSTTVSDLNVVAGKIMPKTEDPKSATCEFMVATDPGFLAQIGVAQRGGDPFYMMDLPDMPNPAVPPSAPSALLGPRLFLPTRAPLIVDRVSAPLSAPGSALPAIARQYKGVAAQSKNSADRPVEVTAQRLYNIDAPPLGVPGEFSIQQGLDACRGFYGTDAGSSEIAYRDKYLPTAMALFEHRRYGESLDYFRRGFDKLSYQNGGDEAALMIGKLYLGAPGVERNAREATKWLERAAGAKFDRITSMPQFDPREPERNTAMGEAAMILGALYRDGAPDVAKDPARARKWFERARYVGHVRACLVLGDIYYYGKDAPRDLAEAFRYYKEGATLGDAPAQQALAEMYYSGEAPGGRDLKQAVSWHSQAAKIGHAPSLFALATAFENGEGVAADKKAALTLYKMAALGGSAAAKNAVGTYFYEGQVLPKDPAIARLWFQQGAIEGDPDAMFNLGAMMMKGEGGSVDRVHAWAWFKLAERSENPQAAAAVRALEPQMTADEKAQAAKLVGPINS